MAVDYNYYTNTYGGNSIPQEDWPSVCNRATAVIERYKRIYVVTAPDANAESNAICAVADSIYFFDNSVTAGLYNSSSIGSVSSSMGGAAIDVSPKGQAAEFYRCACLYLDIYRGNGHVTEGES